MAQVSLYASDSATAGARFTAAALAAREPSLSSAAEIVSLAPEQLDGSLVVRVGESADRRSTRTVAFQPDSSWPETRSASQWWEQLASYDASGSLSLLQRDDLTGLLTVNVSSGLPTGTVNAFTRYQGLNAERTSLEPSFSVSSGSWQASELLPSRQSDLHALLTAGNDTVIGTVLDDHLSAGPGLNNLFGNEGGDLFLLGAGRSGRWQRRQSSQSGVLLQQRSGSGRKRFLYDADVDLVRDFERSVDVLALPSRPSSYVYVDDKLGTLVFANRSKRDLVAVIDGVKGLDAADFTAI